MFCKTFLSKVVVGFGLLLTVACHGQSSDAPVVFIGSTPGDDPVKSVLSISTGAKVDFIRWKLELMKSNKCFRLNINYGESQPNTLGFRQGGSFNSFQGTFKEDKEGFYSIYRLTSPAMGSDLVLAKVNDNLVHVLISGKLMVGNGGWSYTLNRDDGRNTALIPTLAPPGEILSDKTIQKVFEGRTPCREIAADHPEMNVSSECFKLKWKLVLNRDPSTHLPSTCVVRKVVDNEPRDVKGQWRIVKGVSTNPNAVIYTLEFDSPEESLSFLVGNDVLFFLGNNGALLTGNSDFSFTLNAAKAKTP
jgi:hypothetical protein